MGPPASRRVDDSRLISAVLAGDEMAARALFERHVAGVHRVVWQITRDCDLTDDLVQDTFVRAFSRLGEVRKKESIAAWLRRIAVNLTLNAMQPSGTRGREVELIPEVHPVETEGDLMLRELIVEAIRRLTPRNRAVVFMTLDGYSHEEIATAIGITVAASKTRLSRAREQLREMLSPVLER